MQNTEAFKMKNPEQKKAQFDILYETWENHSDKHYASELDQSRNSDTKRENDFLSPQLAAGSLPINTSVGGEQHTFIFFIWNKK